MPFFIYFNMKKYYILFIFILLVCTITFTKAKSNKSNLRLLTKVIYLDAGHGGRDPGSTYKNIYEKDINLSIVKCLKQYLEQEGAIVYLTRSGDYDLNSNKSDRKKSDLNNRAYAINSSNADIYISIHLNSINSSTWSGAQVFYDDVNDNNIVLANILQKNFKKELNTNRKVKEIKTMLMNRKITIPGVLIEAGFLSNPSDRYLLQKKEYQNKIAIVIRESIIEYFNK